MDDPADTAASKFAQGFNCAQSVFAAFAPAFGLNETTALKIASPFGGGVARQGEICGAVSGALMVLGLKLGSSHPEGKEETYRLSQEFLRVFKEKHGTLLCRELLGYNLSDPEAREQARQSGVLKTVCPFVVREAAGIVGQMLDK